MKIICSFIAILSIIELIVFPIVFTYFYTNKIAVLLVTMPLILLVILSIEIFNYKYKMLFFVEIKLSLGFRIFISTLKVIIYMVIIPVLLYYYSPKYSNNIRIIYIILLVVACHTLSSHERGKGVARDRLAMIKLGICDIIFPFFIWDIVFTYLEFENILSQT
nr:hypothetical protein [uncultured Cardiobacterium sp.]